MKNKVLISWIVFALCVVLAVVFWFLLRDYNPEYEEVQVKVLSTSTKQVKNRKTGSTYNFYEVKVEYNGEEYDLGNAHSVSQYPRGKTVKAYLAKGKLYANVEGVKTSSPIGIVYYVFLIGSFVMLIVAATVTSNRAKEKKLEKQE